MRPDLFERGSAGEATERDTAGAETPAGLRPSRMPVPVALVTLDGTAVEWSDAAAALFGWPRFGTHAAGAPRLSRHSPLWFRRLVERVLIPDAARSACIGLRRRSRRGERRMRVHAGAVHDARGRTAGLLLFMEDRSRPRRLNLELRASERRYDDLVESHPEAIFIHDDEAILVANPAACRLFGAGRPDLLVGRPLLDLVVPDVRARFAAWLRDARGRRAASANEPSVATLDGRTIDVDVVATPITYRRSPAVLLRVRERTRPDRALDAERLRLFAESVREVALVVLDGDGRVAAWNGGAERFLGATAADMIGRTVDTLFPGDDSRDAEGSRLDGLMRTARETGRYEGEGWVARTDGDRFWAAIALAALRSAPGDVLGFGLIVRDLTDRRNAEAALRHSEEQLRHAQKMEGIGRLAGGIAHDFNNLLTAIQGHAQFLLEDLGADHPARTDADEIKRAADRAAGLTRQLLTFSRRQVLEPQILDVNGVIRDMNRMLRRVIREDIALVTILDEAAWPALADAGQLEQILMNLVVNARDAMPGGGTITVETRNLVVDGTWMDVAGPRNGEYVQIVVSDTGTGMDRETMARIFEPFFTTKPEGEGTGLGLATVYGIVRQSGGHISVYSEPGRGTTLKVLLPRAREEDDVPADVEPGELARGWESVLVVEDDPAVRALASRVLQDRGYSVLEAASAPEAIRIAEAYGPPIDLLVTDLIVPDMSGRRLAESIRAHHPGIRTLFMSGFTRRDVQHQGLLEPGAPFIEKPFTAPLLAASVRRALDTQ
jgi:two-component system cell cycle sensor histidine kinase/response regulator CckA